MRRAQAKTAADTAPVRAAFYARVTADESLKRDLSLPNQQARFTELAEANGWEPTLFVEPAAVSGEYGPEQRPALSELITAIEQGEVDAVVVRHLDRLGRGPVLEQLIDLLRRRRIRLFSFDGEMDIRSAAGRLSIRAQAMVGAFEVERTGERVREMRRQKARRGEYVGPTPYGFQSQARCLRELQDLAGDDEDAQRRAQDEAQERYPRSGHLYVDEGEAEVVRLIFRYYTEDRWGARTIALRLNELGYRSRANALWYSQTVLKVLKDPKVAGLITFDEESYDARVPSSKPIWKQARYEGRHTAIIDADLFEEAEAIRQGRGQAIPKKTATKATVYPLTGVICCAHGHPMRSKDSGGIAKPRYFCQPRFHHGPDPAQGGCDADTVEAAFAEKSVREVLGKLLNNPGQVKRILDAALHRERDQRRNPTTEVKEVQALDARIKQLEGSLQRWFDMIEDATPGSRQETLALDRLAKVKETLAEVQLHRDRLAGTVIALPVRVSEAQVEDFLRSVVSKLNRNKTRFQELVGVLVEQHGLEVVALDEEHVRVSLALNPAAMVGQGSGDEGPRARLSATVTLQREETAVEWAARLNAKGGPLCACGCGERIVVQPGHRAPSRGLPRFVSGHQKASTTAMVEALNAEGLLTIAQAARAMGIGETTLRRRVERGEVEVVERGWGEGRMVTCVSKMAVEN
ncbi:MAG: recombinase family protein [Polyangiaceae bacterium]|nr:recombinase family protein [Polyangiaceae bacterium]